MRLWNSILPEPGQPSAQLSKLICLTACKKTKHTVIRWYRTVYIPWLVASYDTHKGKRWMNSNLTKPQGYTVHASNITSSCQFRHLTRSTHPQHNELMPITAYHERCSFLINNRWQQMHKYTSMKSLRTKKYQLFFVKYFIICEKLIWNSDNYCKLNNTWIKSLRLRMETCF